MKIQRNYYPKEKRVNIRVTSFLFLVAFIMTSFVTDAAAKKAKFSGEWTLNNEKSYIGEYGEMMASTKLIINQKGKKLTIERFGTSQDGENYTYTEKYTLDGKECENIIFETTKKKSTANWSEDKKSLTITSTIWFEFEGNELEVSLIEVLEFTEDGYSLSINQKASTDYGDLENTLVYDKE
ncbi:MAG: hypothetical protein KAX05_04030 [Bacteroidales bacterium]|nr:hypothetical protein [Bacteroidales bacterium]